MVRRQAVPGQNLLAFFMVGADGQRYAAPSDSHLIPDIEGGFAVA